MPSIAPTISPALAVKDQACRSVTKVSRVEGVYTIETELLPVIDAIKNINMISKVRIGLVKTSNFVDLVDEVAGNSWPLNISAFLSTC